MIAAARVALMFGLDPLVVLNADRQDWTVRAACYAAAAAELDRRPRG